MDRGLTIMIYSAIVGFAFTALPGFLVIHRLIRALRDCFLKTLWDTDATDFTDAGRAEKTVTKGLLSVGFVKSVYKKMAATT